MNLLLVVPLLVPALDDPALPRPLARVASTKLEVGTTLELVVGFENAPPGWWGNANDVRTSRPILQLDVPEGVKLLGSGPWNKTTPRDFEISYLRFPYGRKLFEEETVVRFELREEVPADTTLGLNLVAWLDGDDPERARFERWRLELPVAAGAVAAEGDPRNTRWGLRETLDIGETLDAFELPTHDGGTLRREDLLGAPALLLTYRAHW